MLLIEVLLPVFVNIFCVLPVPNIIMVQSKLLSLTYNNKKKIIEMNYNTSMSNVSIAHLERSMENTTYSFEIKNNCLYKVYICCHDIRGQLFRTINRKTRGLIIVDHIAGIPKI